MKRLCNYLYLTIDKPLLLVIFHCAAIIHREGVKSISGSVVTPVGGNFKFTTS